MTTETRPRFIRRAGILPLLLPVLAACEVLPGNTGTPSIPVTPPEFREGASLFENEEIVRILEFQNRRDGAALIERLEHSDAEVRARAAFALASVQDPGATPVLIRLLEDPEPAVRRDAALALSHLPLPDGGQALMAALGVEEHPAARRRILDALGARGDEAVAAELIEWEPLEAEGEDYYMALSRMGLRGAIPSTPAYFDRLLEGLRSEGPRDREAAAYYFGRQPDPEPWTARAEAVREALRTLDPADPAAMHLLPAIGRLRDRADAPLIMEWMAGAEDWRVRVNAVRSAGTSVMLETEGMRDALWERVEGDPSEHVAVAAAEALLAGFRVPPSVLQRARAWFEVDPDRWRTHLPFIERFAMDGEAEIVYAWLDFHAPRYIELERMAPGILIHHPDLEATYRVLELALHDDLGVRAAALRLLSRQWDTWLGAPDLLYDFFDLFTEAVLEGHPHAALHGAVGLGNPSFHEFGVVPVLLEAYENRTEIGGEREVPVIAAILNSIAVVGDPAGLDAIRDALESEDFRIRRAGAAAHRRLTGQEIRGLEIPEVETEIDFQYLRALGPHPVLVLQTMHGFLRIRLAPDQAPLTVQTVARYAERGWYDEVPFHRVIANFVAQAGDFWAGDGTGTPARRIRTELTQIPFRRGVIGMASSGRDTEGSQFFIVHSMQPHLDGSFGAQGEWLAYTSFGWLEEGEAVLDAIMQGDRIVRATIERSGEEPTVP